MKIYLAGPLFTTPEREFNAQLATRLRSVGHEVFVPQEHPASEPTGKAIFLKDLAGLDWADGVVAITIRPINQWQGRKPPADVFHLYRGDEVAKLLSDSGFRRPRVEPYPEREKPGECILALK